MKAKIDLDFDEVACEATVKINNQEETIIRRHHLDWLFSAIQTYIEKKAEEQGISLS